MNVGDLRHVVTIQNPGVRVPDGDGGYTQEPEILSQRRAASVTPATERDLERVVANTVQSTASHVVRMRFLRGVSTQSQVIFHDPVQGDRLFSVVGIRDPEERHVELVLACEEVIQ